MLATFVALLAAARAANSFTERQSSLSSFISKERSIALNGAINNIGGSGSELVPGAFPGIVVAAPSTFNPDYFYTWTRDSALAFDRRAHSGQHFSPIPYRRLCPRAQAVLQTIANPSGTLYPAGLGLGEPKFYYK
jgi:glucoamylase